MILAPTLEEILDQLEQLTLCYDRKEWRKQALSIHISESALDLLDQVDPPVPYQYYFSTPELLVEHPRLIFYYRNIAMLSGGAMREIDLDSTSYEFGDSVPELAKASEIATYFNGIVSAILLSYDKVLPKQHTL
ncbi:MAG: hypothetical protein DWI57_05590, partial [Chloroflexi bacterium]